MSASIFYSAEQASPFTAADRDALQQVIDRCNATAPVSNAESIGVWTEEEGRRLSGSSKPSTDETMAVSLVHLLTSVSAMRRTLADADWDVTLDDIDIEWDDERGYTLPGLND